MADRPSFSFLFFSPRPSSEMAFERKLLPKLTEEKYLSFSTFGRESNNCIIFDAGSWLSDGIIEVPFVEKVRVDRRIEMSADGAGKYLMLATLVRLWHSRVRAQSMEWNTFRYPGAFYRYSSEGSMPRCALLATPGAASCD